VHQCTLTHSAPPVTAPTPSPSAMESGRARPPSLFVMASDAAPFSDEYHLGQGGKGCGAGAVCVQF
jgi:hypothetical protein